MVATDPAPSDQHMDGFDVVVHSNRAACLVLARNVLRDHHLAEDAVQEALLDAWRLASGYDSARCTEQGWLLMLTRRRAIDRVRKEERHGAAHRSASPLTPREAADAPDDHAWLAERARYLREALATLTAEQHEVLVLAYFGGYTQREIAGLVGIPLGTVKTRTAAAMRRLASLLRYCCDPG